MMLILMSLSIPHWLSYWAVGWQIQSTDCCVEIENIFNQMNILKDRVGVLMPGNKPFITTYLDTVWDIVTSLTSAIDRYTGAPPWLKKKYEDYNNQQEKMLASRLDEIRYDIDDTDTVHLILGREPIEKVDLSMRVRNFIDSKLSIFFLFLW
jgi:hypothetical protein